MFDFDKVLESAEVIITYCATHKCGNCDFYHKKANKCAFQNTIPQDWHEGFYEINLVDEDE